MQRLRDLAHGHPVQKEGREKGWHSLITGMGLRAYAHLCVRAGNIRSGCKYALYFCIF